MKEEDGPFTNFHVMFTAFRWKPIFGCPGRYILKDEKQYSIAELTHGRTDVNTFSSKKARDMVYVVVLDDGGIISYEKDDGTLIHTLNNKAGFIRKLKMLNILQPILKGGEE